MNKGIIKAVVLSVVFLGTLTALSLFPENGNVDLTSEMEEATLPVVYLKSKDTMINKLYGYKGDMNPMTVRDTITPLSEDLALPVVIQTYHGNVDSISYAVRTMDMERLLEEKQLSNYSQENGIIEAGLQIQNLMEPGKEYMLILTLESQGEKIDYYTRVIRPMDSYVDESLAFVLDFHEKTFDKESATELAMYLEQSNEEGDNTTLERVTIYSSLNQVAWGDFKGKRLEEPVPSVKEISDNYNTIVLNYVMASTGVNGESEYYNVEEYFRVRSGGTNSRMYLLSYERTMKEIFRGNGIKESEILLGIRDMDVHYLTNESGTIICFVQEGELWGYNTGSNQLSFIYSFRGAEGVNERENNPNHEIRIIEVDETGSVDFVVFGYMNRGNREGAVGVGVYHYDSVANTIEEVLFVYGDKSYQALKEDWGKLFYISDEGMFYMIGDQALYRVDMETGKEEKLLFGLYEDNYAVSEDGRYIAWRKEADKQLLSITDLEGEAQYQITVKAGERINPIGFIQNDFAYGIARDTDESEGLLPMYKIVIVNKEQKVEKEYEKLFTNAYVEDGTIILERVTKNGDGYAPTEPDSIKSRNMETDQNVRLDTMYSEEKQTQVKLVIMQKFLTKKPQILTPKVIVQEKEQTIELKSEDTLTCYHAYAGGKIILCTESLKEAIQCADSNAGVVIGGRQEYFWRRGKKSGISLEDKVILSEAELAALTSLTGRCLAAFLQVEAISLDIEGRINSGKTSLEIIREALPEDKVLDLTGCDVTQVLYYVDSGAAVYTLGENKEPLLIVGYDEHNTILYNPETNTVFKMGLQDSVAYFEGAGNIFISYIRQER